MLLSKKGQKICISGKALVFKPDLCLFDILSDGYVSQMKHSSDLKNNGCPVIGLSDEYSAGFTDTWHSHERPQLLYAITGVMSVSTTAAQYTVPPQRALLIPAGMGHEVSCRDSVALRTLYFENSAELPDGCILMEISEFLRALIVEVVSFDRSQPASERDMKIAELLITELKAMPAAPYSVSMPSDPRLLRVCKAISEDPSDPRDLDAWASYAAMGRRTFTRMFREQTGMSLTTWKQQIRLMEALSLLDSGHSVTDIAFRLGYESVSAFIAMFRKFFGTSPTRYGRKDTR